MCRSTLPILENNYPRFPSSLKLFDFERGLQASTYGRVYHLVEGAQTNSLVETGFLPLAKIGQLTGLSLKQAR